MKKKKKKKDSSIGCRNTFQNRKVSRMAVPALLLWFFVLVVLVRGVECGSSRGRSGSLEPVKVESKVSAFTRHENGDSDVDNDGC